MVAPRWLLRVLYLRNSAIERRRKVNLVAFLQILWHPISARHDSRALQWSNDKRMFRTQQFDKRDDWCSYPSDFPTTATILDHKNSTPLVANWSANNQPKSSDSMRWLSIPFASRPGWIPCNHWIAWLSPYIGKLEVVLEIRNLYACAWERFVCHLLSEKYRRDAATMRRWRLDRIGSVSFTQPSEERSRGRGPMSISPNHRSVNWNRTHLYCTSLTFQGRVGRHAIECEGSPLSLAKKRGDMPAGKLSKETRSDRQTTKSFYIGRNSSKGAEADGRAYPHYHSCLLS